MAEFKTETFTVTRPDTGETPRSKTSLFDKYIQPCMAELFGTTLFVFVGCASVIGNAALEGAVQPAVAHGLALGVLITVFGEISGGHFNPAVTVCVYLCGGMKLILLVPYVLAQMSGGMIGAGLAKAIYPSAMFINSSGAAFNVLAPTDSPGGATVAEMMMTLFLTVVVCMGAINSRTSSRLAPFCIGLTVTACILAGGSVSGACMNPARAFGPAVVSGHWDHHWLYWVGPLCGALTTVSLVRLMFGDQKMRVVCK